MLRSILITAALISLAACGKSAENSGEHATSEVKASKTAETELFVIEDAFVRAPLEGKDVTSAYFTIKSNSDQYASLIAVTTPDADTAELHTHILNGTRMAMRKVDYIDIPQNGSAVLKPMSDHIMLFGPREDLKAGDTVLLEVTILSDGEAKVFTVSAPVKALG